MSEPAAAAARRTYLDVLRGVAVLIMIAAHVVDSWTRLADRQLRAFGESLILGGFGAPMFLFLAGVAVAMSAGSKARRTADDRSAMRTVQKRGLQIFALAFVFRLQSLVLSNAPAWTMLKVDILNIMGLAIVLAATIWGVSRGTRVRIAAFAAATVAVVLATPVIRAIPALGGLPNSLEGYLRPIPGLTNFTLFPWIAFVMAGALVGVVLDASRSREADRRANIWFGIGGAALAVGAYYTSFLPPLDGRSRFWTTSMSFFFIRLGIIVAALGAAWLWEQRPTRGRWSPLQQLGRSSLFVYWIHVELVYGLISLPLHGAFSLAGAWTGFLLFAGLMVAVVVVKDHVSRKYLSKIDLREKLSRQVQALVFYRRLNIK
jgi:uncharacterized membrane protein